MIIHQEFKNTVSEKKNAFWFDLGIRHSSRGLTHVTNVLGIRPWLAFNKGDTMGSRTWQHSSWTALIAEGTLSARAYERCLRKIYKLILKHSSLFNELAAEGEIELTFNYNIDWNDGLLLQVSFYPELLASLSSSHVALRLQGWSRKAECAATKTKTVRKSATRIRTPKK
jgi:hypothetical protein